MHYCASYAFFQHFMASLNPVDGASGSGNDPPDRKPPGGYNEHAAQQEVEAGSVAATLLLIICQIIHLLFGGAADTSMALPSAQESPQTPVVSGFTTTRFYAVFVGLEVGVFDSW